MTETANAPNTSDLTKNPLDTFHPYYYNSFQNYCCGSKSNSTTSSQLKGVLPIPKTFKGDAAKLLKAINRIIIEDLTRLTEWTSVIPNIFFEPDNNFSINRYLIDRVMFKTLKEAHIINWISAFKLLYPIRTSGNGNCLLHAVLIAMVGVHDLDLYLRDRLVHFMNENKDLLKIRWRTERIKSDKAYGIQSEDPELDREWDELCDLVRYENPEDGKSVSQLQYLEAVHIFSISNMLRRPIIVLSEDVIRNKNGEAISPNDLFGIYLPILSQSSECVNEPIVLAYDQSHFCPLLTNDIRSGKTSDNLLPLYPSIDHAYDQKLLPVRFLGNDVSVEQSNDLLHGYLRIQRIDYSFDSKSPSLSILCADLGSKNLVLDDNFFHLYYQYAKDFFEIQKPRAIEEERKKRRREEEHYISNQSQLKISPRSSSSCPSSPSLSKPISSKDSSSINTESKNKSSTYCKSCKEGKGTTRCEGCDMLLCLSCMNKHHDELKQEFQQLMNVQNELKETLDTAETTSKDDKTFPCLVDIDRWERETIEHIREIATNGRMQINDMMTKNVAEIRYQLEQLTKNMQQHQKKGNYLENDIEQAKGQLEYLKKSIQHMMEKVRVDCTMSNKIDWKSLLHIITENSLDISEYVVVQKSDNKNNPQITEEKHPTTKPINRNPNKQLTSQSNASLPPKSNNPASLAPVSSPKRPSSRTPVARKRQDT